MEQRLVCDTVRDLLPMYIDHMTSDASNESIEEHIGGCRECEMVLKQMQEPVFVEPAPEVEDFKKFLKKSRMGLFYWVMGAAAVIAIVTCFIVNLAVEGRLSWFYIVIVSIVTGYLPVYLVISGQKHRVLKMLACLNLCVFFLIGVIQLTLYYEMGIGDIWFWKYGAPIAALWSVILWFTVLVRVKFHATLLTSFVVFLWLAVAGNFLTNMLCGHYTGVGDYMTRFLTDGFGNVATAVAFLLLDFIVYCKKKGKVERGE